MLDYMAHVYVRPDGLAAVLVTDVEYPARTAFSVLNRITDEFTAKFNRSEWSALSPANTASKYPE